MKKMLLLFSYAFYSSVMQKQILLSTIFDSQNHWTNFTFKSLVYN